LTCVKAKSNSQHKNQAEGWKTIYKGIPLNDRRPAMNRQRILFAAPRAVLAIAAVIGFGVATSNDLRAAEPNKPMKPPARNSQQKMSFQDDVMPIFVGRCISCHQPNAQGTQASGLDLTSYASLMKGTKFGPMVIPGDPESSNLMLLLDWRAAPELRMPLGKRQLSPDDRNAIRSWIREGAKDN
jgi:mono/diheme cytochrome c family protein